MKCKRTVCEKEGLRVHRHTGDLYCRTCAHAINANGQIIDGEWWRLLARKFHGKAVSIDRRDYVVFTTTEGCVISHINGDYFILHWFPEFEVDLLTQLTTDHTLRSEGIKAANYKALVEQLEGLFQT